MPHRKIYANDAENGRGCIKCPPKERATKNFCAEFAEKWGD